MAKRPAWTIKDGKVVRDEFEFQWNGGFAVVQKQKNINNLHAAIRAKYSQSALEVSSKGMVSLGNAMSAFSLKFDGILLENVFQSSKKFENGGPYRDLLSVAPRDAKRDERIRNSGRITSFCLGNDVWPTEPKTAFYDYIYVVALIQNYGVTLNLDEYVWFTDIEFNPERSVNCQARAAAIYKLLQKTGMWGCVNKKSNWLTFHKYFVLG